MKLIVGLGNPGAKYQLTRHNIGFMVIDGLAKHFNAPESNVRIGPEKKSLTYKVNPEGGPAILCKPQTFMNLSGEAVRPLMDFYKTDLKDLLVIHDEVDLPFGQVKLQRSRGHGGNNGIRSIHEVLGTKEYARVRVGVGRPTNSKMEMADHVLQNFSPAEQHHLPELISFCAEACLEFIATNYEKAATSFNSKSLEISL